MKRKSMIAAIIFAIVTLTMARAESRMSSQEPDDMSNSLIKENVAQRPCMIAVDSRHLLGGESLI